MKRLLAALVTMVALLGSVVVAQAATLTLDAGTLQTLRVNQSPPPPGPPPVRTFELTVVDWIYSGDSRNKHSREDFGPFLIPEGSSYDLDWVLPPEKTDPAQTLDECRTGGQGQQAKHPPSEARKGVGSNFEISDDLTHYVCSQNNWARGEPRVTVDGSVIEPEDDEGDP